MESCRGLVLAALALGAGVIQPSALHAQAGPERLENVPDWAADAVFYQIFPERFRNGDPANDPTRDQQEHHAVVPENWRITPWTSDWYARADWEQAIGPSFYDDGIYNRRYGGDLQGVIDKLDYLKDLGINALYFNPVFYARSLHKYDGNTFHHIDPHFGPDPEGDFALMATETSDPATWKLTEADELFIDLVDEAHDRGIRVIIDGVWNHTGRDFFAFQDIVENQERSPYKDWYVVSRFDDPATPENEFAYQGWWNVPSLPEFADTPDGQDLHPGPKQYIFDATRRWMDPNGDGDPSDGVDGWRLDVVPWLPKGFWPGWHRHVRSINPQAYTTSEVWEDASEHVRDLGFSATMNYYAFAYPVKGWLIDRAIGPAEFVEQLNERREAYPAAGRYALQNLMDSHDTDRLASMIVNARRQPYEQPERFDYDVSTRTDARHSNRYDVRAPNARERQTQRLVALFQMTYLGAPMIYYGTEAGMWGGDDPDDRKPMVWPEFSYDDEASDPLGRPRTPDPVRFDHALHGYYRDLIHLRNAHAALRRGDFRVLLAQDEQDVLAYSRSYGDETVVVVLNRGERDRSVSVALPQELRGDYRVIFPSGETEANTYGGSEGFSITVQGGSGVVLKRR